MGVFMKARYDTSYPSNAASWVRLLAIRGARMRLPEDVRIEQPREGDVYISDAARHLGISTQHLRALERAGRVPRARRDQFGDRIYSDADLLLLEEIGVGARPRPILTPLEELALERN
jgi:MerR HTH family regulatory protein